ncbi:RING-H2 finger protein ATL63-like [Lolium rigidum]|uniref:RING-H2 finger protein ATL63-like n=1 Tax=Lolium rigidum TaxID=89674 RepID=UPI001F5CFC3F|nr:RING-H2 finger protein ATL63-like [Lolium rigidum]
MTPFAPPYNTNVLLAAVTALSAAIAFVAALHLYARCFLQQRSAATSTTNPHALALQRPPDGYGYELHAISVVVDAAVCAPDEAAGLGAKELGALQVLVWESSSSAKEKEATFDEHCAVCLGEMEDGELGRLLPACRHVFHVGCIDAWLRLSSTCPVCRSAVRTELDAAAPAAAVEPLSYC